MEYGLFELSARALGLAFRFDGSKAPEVEKLSEESLSRLISLAFDCRLALHSGSIAEAIHTGVFDPSWVSDATNLVPLKITCVGHSLDGDQLSVDLDFDFPPVSLRADISCIDDLNQHCDGWATDLLDSIAMNNFGLKAFGFYDEVGIDQKSIYLDKRNVI